MLHLEIYCLECDGTGIIEDCDDMGDPIQEKCNICRGRGKILSKNGKEYLETLKWYLSQGESHGPRTGMP